MTTPSDPAAAPQEYALELRQVSRAFVTGQRRVTALDDVSLRVQHGRVTGLIGPDGAGKTTLMRLAAGLLIPDSGSLSVLGLDTTREALAVQSNIGYMPQRFGLYEDLSVQENLDLYADLQGVPHAERAARYRELMHMTGLAPFTRRLAGRLSGGMKQKLGLACTLVRPPRLLLLDEPTVGVDPVSRRELWAIVYRLVKEEAMSVLLSTAYLDEAERCGEVILLHEGHVLWTGVPQSFSERVQGRTYAVSDPKLSKRTVQERLSRASDVLDAVIQGDHVRVVMHTDAAPTLEQLLPGEPDAQLTAVAPRFEDAFIDRLKSGRTDTAPVAQTASTPTPATNGPVIEVRKVQRRFGDFYAVKDVSFEVRRGEVFGLLGANGAGKTTTFRMLCGLLPASGGELRVAGLDLRIAAAAARARIGYMSQKFSLYGHLTVNENLGFFASCYGLNGERQRTRIDWALEEFELQSSADAVSADLSLGYKQRLALASALMHEPEILFLDEPTSGVDPLARREFWQRINAQAERGVTVLVTTHFMEEAEYCDRLAIMAAGEILTLGTPAEIKVAARTAEKPDPTMEDAFIELIEAHERTEAA